MRCCVVWCALVAAIVFANPASAARKSQKQLAIADDDLEEGNKPVKCCCMKGRCEKKGNYKIKVDVKLDDKQFCCKPRKRAYFASIATCDKDKYSHRYSLDLEQAILDSDGQLRQSKKLDVTTCAVIPTPAPTVAPTFAPTAALTSPSPETTAVPTPAIAEEKAIKCCCMSGRCQMKGNPEDKSKVDIQFGDQDFCCKPRKKSMFSAQAKCDKDKYTFELKSIQDSGNLLKRSKMLNFNTCAEIPTPAPTVAPTTTPTPAPIQALAARAPTPSPTPDPYSLTDITKSFLPAKRVLRIRDDSFMCCCHEAQDQDVPTISCELVHTSAKPVYASKSGCGGLKGDGFHSWISIATMSKYFYHENLGKCVVPLNQAITLE